MCISSFDGDPQRTESVLLLYNIGTVLHLSLEDAIIMDWFLELCQTSGFLSLTPSTYSMPSRYAATIAQPSHSEP